MAPGCEGDDDGERWNDDGGNAEGALQANTGTNDRFHRTISLREQLQQRPEQATIMVLQLRTRVKQY